LKTGNAIIFPAASISHKFWVTVQRTSSLTIYLLSQTPILQGTGVEDFFNGGWYFKNGLFTQPTHGNTAYATTGGQDQIAAYRLFLSDVIPFRKHIRVGMEHGLRNSMRMDSWTLVYYYYQPTPRAVLTDVLDVGLRVCENIPCGAGV
jgi:hypothetical protein